MTAPAALPPRLLLHEDEHLLVVRKPAGWNTHAPAPHAGEGLYDWLRHRDPRWAALAIIHRLDKETSGVILFTKTPLANRSLTQQFTTRRVHKKYLLVTDRPVSRTAFHVSSELVRAGESYVSRSGGEPAETSFRVVRSAGGRTELEAEPFTGRTHQIRVHAAESGFPILGDTLYGGTPAARLHLHSSELAFEHPATGDPVSFRAGADFDADPRLALRAAFIEPEATNAFRLVHGAADGHPGWYVERLGNHLLSQSGAELDTGKSAFLARLLNEAGAGAAAGCYHKILSRHLRGAKTAEASARLIAGQPAPERFAILENGAQFELSFAEGYSVGLFLDQRDNRRRFLVNHVAAGFPLFAGGTAGREVLNTFAYTCGFSVCAARAGARVTSLDLSKKYLDWGRRNFALNQLDPAGHDFIFGDAFDWLRRLAKKGRAFDAIILDPPTFSQSKERGVFRAEKDYGKLVAAALPLLKPDGVLLASANAAELTPERFLAMIDAAVLAADRKITQRHYAPQPPDFPIHREEPAHLKTVWLRVAPRQTK